MGSLRNFYTFQLGIIFGYLGLRLAIFACAWYLLEGKGLASMAFVISAAGIFEAFAGPMVAPFADRSRVQVVITTFVFQIVVCLFLIASLGSLTSNWLLVIFTFGIVLCTCLDAARDPVADAAIPELINGSSTTDAVRVRRMLGTGSRVMGPAVGGAVTALFGSTYTLALAALAFFVGLLMAVVVIRSTPQSFGTYPPEYFTNKDGEKPRNGFSRWWHDVKAGANCTKRIPPEMGVAVSNLLINLSLPAFIVVMVPLLAQSLSGGGAWVAGIADAMFGFGIFLGAWKVVPWLNRSIGRHKTVGIGYVVISVGFLALTLVLSLDSAFMLFGVSAVMGIAVMALSINLMALRLTACPASFRTRLIANTAFLSGMGGSLGLAIYGMLGTMLNPLAIFSIACVLCAISFFIFTRVTILSKILNWEDRRQKNLYVRLYPQAFKPNEII
jgi:MFS family permease